MLADSPEGIGAGVPLGPIEGRKLDGRMHIGEIPTLFSSLLPPAPLSSPSLTIVHARYSEKIYRFAANYYSRGSSSRR
jgi:hypothetical protein